MKASSYLSDVQARMSQNGYDNRTGALPPGAALLGHVGQFRWTWYATKLHLFVAVKQVESATRHDLEEFTTQTLTTAKRAKGRIRGLQTGVAAIAVLVANHVDTDAAQFAQTELLRQFAAFAWPVTVDLSTGQRLNHLGNPKIGHVYNRWMRQQIDAVVPAPTLHS